MFNLKIKNLRWYIVVLLLLVTTINYMDRTCLGVAGPTLKEKLSINNKQFSYIIMCFQITYLIMQPITGRILDWLGTKRGLLLAASWWSIVNMLHAFARTTFSFSIFRFLLGIGEAANFPGVAKTISEWIPPRERTIAVGIANIGSGTGAMVATPLVIAIILKWGWQEAFVITGAIGFIWVALWKLFYYSPEKHPLITKGELDYIHQGQKELDVEDSTSEKGVFKLVLRQKNFWGIALARFLSDPSWSFFSYWIPMYLVAERNLDLKGIAYFGWMPFLAADIGSFLGGFISPLYQKLGLSVLNSRKAAMTTAAFIMPLSILVIKAPTAGWAIFWICCASFAHNCISAVLLTLPVDLFPKRTVATANGLSGTAAHLGATTATLLTGMVVTYMGYAPIFAAIGFLDIIGAALLWILIRQPKMKNTAPQANPV